MTGCCKLAVRKASTEASISHCNIQGLVEKVKILLNKLVNHPQKKKKEKKQNKLTKINLNFKKDLMPCIRKPYS